MMSNHEEIQEDSLRMLNIGRDDEFADSVSNKYFKGERFYTLLDPDWTNSFRLFSHSAFL